MKPAENTQQDPWKKLFSEVRMENPSSGFTQNLMLKIEKEAIRQKRKRQVLSYLYIAAGISGILITSSAFLYFLGVKTPKLNPSLDTSGLATAFRSLNFDPLIVSCSLSVFFLLIGDCLIRKHIHRKNKHNNIT